MDVEQLLTFLETMGKMKTTFRHCELLPGRGESVAEHSWRLSLMALLLRDRFPGVDMERVLDLCVVHDIGEAVTGDIPAFNKTEADEAREAKVVRDLLRQTGPARGYLEALFEELAQQQTREAKLCRALDMMEAVLSHNESPLESWSPVEYELNLVYGEQEAQAFALLREMRGALRRATEQKLREGAPHAADIPKK